MKKILVGCIFALGLNAQSVSIQGLGYSHHSNKNLNSKHKLVGLSYQFFKKDNLEVSVQYNNFTNSYNNKVNIIAVAATILPIKYKDIEVGGTLAVGYQKGYRIENFMPVKSKSGNDTGVIILPALTVRMNKSLSLHIIPMKTGVSGKVEMKLFSW